jgi:hypothetical protein
MARRVVLLLASCFLTTACGKQSAPGEASQSSTLQESGVDDSLRALVKAYENGGLSLARGAQLVADLVEPTGGLAVEWRASPAATELLQAAGRELQSRQVHRYERPDSQP